MWYHVRRERDCSGRLCQTLPAAVSGRDAFFFMRLGNFIRNWYFFGNGWSVHVTLDADDEQALEMAKACLNNIVHSTHSEVVTRDNCDNGDD